MATTTTTKKKPRNELAPGLIGRCTKRGFCRALKHCMSGVNRAGIHPVQVFQFTTGRVSIIGAAYKQREGDRAVMFAVCPFCRTDLGFLLAQGPARAKKAGRAA
jgi:hypothetical protein